MCLKLLWRNDIFRNVTACCEIKIIKHELFVLKLKLFEIWLRIFRIISFMRGLMYGSFWIMTLIHLRYIQFNIMISENIYTYKKILCFICIKMKCCEKMINMIISKGNPEINSESVQATITEFSSRAIFSRPYLSFGE